MGLWNPKADISIGEMPRHILRIEFTWYGTERYLLDGKQIAKYWNLHSKKTRFFKIGDHEVEFRYNLWQMLCALYIDGELYSEQIFPDFVKYRQYIHNK